MNRNRTSFARPGLPFFLTLALAGTAQAGFTYNPRDLVFGFREDGGTSELVVNAGPASRYYLLSSGSITITNLTPYFLTTTFPDINNLNWSGAAVVRTNGDAAYPIQTLWVIRP